MVYKFTCGGCESVYIGFTTRYLTTRINEHLNLDKNSHIFKHLLESPDCKQKCTNKNFEIIDRSNDEYSLKIKEAIWIKELKPRLNVQLDNVFKLNLFI